MMELKVKGELMRPSRRLWLTAVLVLFAFPTVGIFQTDPARGQVVEVTFDSGRPPGYQRVGEWTWYGAFPRVKDWKLPSGTLHIEAVKVSPRAENGFIFVRVTVLRGRNLEVEDFVADHKLSDGIKTTVSELSNFGVVPFALAIARAPSTVAELPSVVNKTRSLEVDVHPTTSTIPSFKVRVLNNSHKRVFAFAFQTSIDGKKMLTAVPQSQTEESLIEPGDVFERQIRYPLKPGSTGEVPSARSNLVLNVSAVIFFDGTYEGDVFDAASYLVINHGERLQVKRFLTLLRSTGFNGLSSEIDAAVIAHPDRTGFAEFAGNFIGLTDNQKKDLLEIMEVGGARAVKSFKAEFTSTEAPLSPEFFQALITKYEKRLTALP